MDAKDHVFQAILAAVSTLRRGWLIAILVATCGSGCLQFSPGTSIAPTHAINVVPVDEPTAFFADGMSFQITGTIYAAANQRVEFGVHSFTATVLQASGPLPAENDPQSGHADQHPLAPATAILKGAPGSHTFWVWYAIFDDPLQVPVHSGWKDFYITGNDAEATFYGSDAPGRGQGTSGQTQDAPETPALQVRKSGNDETYHATATNVGTRPAPAWLFASFHDYSAQQWERRPLEPQQIRPLNLAAQESAEITFERVPWNSESNYGYDVVLLRFHPKMRQLDEKVEFALHRPAGETTIQVIH